MSNFKFNNNGILAIWNRVLVLLKMITGDVDVIGKGTIQDQLDYLYNHDSSHKIVTTEEFNALTEEEKNNGTIYFISDGNVSGGTVISSNGSIPLLDGTDPNNILEVPVCRMINATGSIPFVATEDSEENVNDFILQTHWYKDTKTNEQRATQLAFSLIDGTIKNRIFNGTEWTDWSAGMGSVDVVQGRNFFVGTKEEFDEAYEAGKLDVGAVVIITDQDEVYVEGQGTVVVDQSLSMTSRNPIGNLPVATKFNEHDNELSTLKKAVGVTTTDISTASEDSQARNGNMQLDSTIVGSLAYSIDQLSKYNYNIQYLTINQDLNMIIDFGNYYTIKNDIVSTLKHRPDEIDQGFYMKVYPFYDTPDSSHIVQEITLAIDGTKYHRLYEDGTWHDWHKINSSVVVTTTD